MWKVHELRLYHMSVVLQAVQDLLPEPDLVQAEQKLEKLLRSIYRSFPSKHWGNSRDAFCFRRVQAPLDSFKVPFLKTLQM